MTDTDLATAGLPSHHPRRTVWQRFRGQPVMNILLLFVLAQLVAVVFALSFPDQFRYLSGTNIGLVLRAIPVIGIVSLGVGLLMITGEYDLSVGSVYTLAGFSLGLLYMAGVPAPAAFALTALIGIAIGVVNGLVTVRTGIPSFIATMGSMLVVRGLVRWLSEGRTVQFRPEGGTGILNGSFAGIEASFLWFVVLTLLAALLLHKTKLGNHMFLVGGNERTAVAVGINARRVKVIAFALASLGATLSGMLSMARVGTVTPGQGTGLELKAIAVCVIGGLFLSGGRGTVLGIFLGACLMYLVEDVLLLLRAPGFYLDVFVGAILVGAVMINTWLIRTSAR